MQTLNLKANHKVVKAYFEVGRLNRLPTFDRFLDLVAHHRCRCG